MGLSPTRHEESPALVVALTSPALIINDVKIGDRAISWNNGDLLLTWHWGGRRRDLALIADVYAESQSHGDKSRRFLSYFRMVGCH